MARQDIDIDPSLGEVNTTDGLTNKVIYDFALLPRVDRADNDLYTYGEITVPQGFENRYSDSAGIHVGIPYPGGRENPSTGAKNTGGRGIQTSS